MPNRLIDENSPYLLQHADNPVDWYPWSDEAFEKAKEEDKPVFLSIGYSTCHWCHVMAHESFEDPKVAQQMNETFVNIKVDREERPDIDDIYMTVCQMATGRGGWPLTIVMTPDQKPFFAATYLPKESRGQQIGMMDLMPRIQELWEERREEALESAEQVMDSLKQTGNDAPGEQLTEETLDRAVRRMQSQFDRSHGGFGGEPKFPSPHNLLFLLRYAHRTKEEGPLEMVEHTLKSMRQGGVYDQVGYGFHRYSTDREWKLPHFEKMLYDQALLSQTYLEAYQVTEDRFYRKTVEEIFTYVLRDLRSQDGGFFSAEDADSEGGEGVYYQWTVKELKNVLGEEDAHIAIEYFNVKEEGNFREEASGQRTGKNVLHPGRPIDEIAPALGISPEKLSEKMASIRERLLEARDERPRPHLDDKILTSWNGLMISALAKAGGVLGEDLYLNAARNGASFVLEHLQIDDARLLHRFRDGESAVLGHADDYAFFIRGLLDLYEATAEASFLQTATNLNEQFLEYFWDEQAGGFYFTAEDGEELITRKKSVQDGAKPSANSVAYLNLLRLARLTGNPDLETRAVQLEEAFADSIQKTPFSHTMFLCGVNQRIGTSHEVVVAGSRDHPETQRFLKAFRSEYHPNSVLLYRPTDETNNEDITTIAPFTEEQDDLNGEPAIYVCSDFSCQAPTTDLDEALDMMRKNGGRG